MSDDTDDEIGLDAEEFHESLTEAFSGLGMFSMGGKEFDTDAGELPEGVQIAIRLLKAGHAIDAFVDFCDERDLEPSELSPMEMEALDHEETAVVFGMASMSDSLERLAEMSDDDDDENPFKVSGGDDPVY